ncbi:Uu.00g117780.m01.CDS01 [Anthostomella pinea]|uniref:carbonic anhydrase n=1 Tax=Anthostomella pinea TaxID=933095 RepID=A0AAI8VG88_9PEZI|nr:Uu.00g117780.m01.CDS01 [Anthostomella pinea]
MSPINQLILLLAASVTPALGFCGGHTHLDRRDEGEVPEFGYFGTKGPLLWNKLATANAVCSTGTRQSPINMVPEVFKLIDAKDIKLTLPGNVDDAMFENLGTTVEVVMKDKKGTITLDKVDYTLKQFHFHHPSEHVDNGVSLPMEMHMVFTTEEAQVAVIGVYVDIIDTSSIMRLARRARPSKMLETIFASVEDIAKADSETELPKLNMSELSKLLLAGKFQSYPGSLTTPPCSEGVSWLVSTQKLMLSQKTFVKVRDVIGFNSRYPQNTPGEANLLSMVTA